MCVAFLFVLTDVLTGIDGCEVLFLGYILLCLAD